MKKILEYLGLSFGSIVLMGCMGGNAQNVSASNTIKVIRENNHVNTNAHTQRMISIGRIEQVDYNSSIIAPEVEGYTDNSVKKQDMEKQNKYTNGIQNKVSNKVSSQVNRAQSKANSAVNGALDNALGRLFR